MKKLKTSSASVTRDNTLRICKNGQRTKLKCHMRETELSFCLTGQRRKLKSHLTNILPRPIKYT